MSCEKLYYNDSYLCEFSATVTDCIADKNNFMVTLDKTAFYPEGGGQPFDTGAFLVGDKKISVLQTREKQDEIYHYTDTPIEKGCSVIGIVDFNRRFDFMQQHTGEHIFSGLVNSNFGYDNVGFHLTEKDMYIDFSGPLSQAQIDSLVQGANDIILKNQPVTANFPDNIATLEYRSKKPIDGKVRIVKAGAADICACCGTHTATTGEVLMLAVVDFANYKSGTRLYISCGKRLFNDYMAKNDAVYKTSRLLSCKVFDTAQAVQNKVNEGETLKQELATLKNELYKQWILPIPQGKLGIFDKEGLTAGELQKISQLINDKCDLACAYSLQQDNTVKICIISKIFDTNAIGSLLCQKLNGKGGGKNGIFQCTVLGSEKIRDILESVV